MEMDSYICYDIRSQVAKVSDHILVSQIDLCVCK